ncbi:MAG TPA: spore germination protein GerW family protein [Candidatus Limnocylindrales bacterium]|nr:spore germination protein GerW family protein [Candidatus Limnocylindrales bacterium]
MDAQELLSHARDAMTVKRAFGDPYERDGILVIPVANVMGGGGGGAGGENAGDPAGEPVPAGGRGGYGQGAGYGVRVTPAGVYVIRGTEVEWQPAVDAGRLAAQRTLTIVLALLVLRSIVKALTKRR